MPTPSEQIVIREIRRKRRAMAIPAEGDTWDRIAVELAARHRLEVGFVRDIIKRETGADRDAALTDPAREEFENKPTRKELDVQS